MQEITVDPQLLPGHLLSEQIVICTQIFAQQIFALPCIGNPPFFTPLSLLLHLRLSDDLKRFVLTFQPPNSSYIFLWVEDFLDFFAFTQSLHGWAHFPCLVLPSLGSRGRVGGEICTTMGELLSAARLLFIFNPPVCSAGQTGGITFRSIPNIFQTFGTIIFCKKKS